MSTKLLTAKRCNLVARLVKMGVLFDFERGESTAPPKARIQMHFINNKVFFNASTMRAVAKCVLKDDCAPIST